MAELRDALAACELKSEHENNKFIEDYRRDTK